MEKIKSGVVFPLDVGWNDVGNWDSIWSVSEKDKLGNTIVGKVLNQKAKNCYLRSESRLLAAIDVEN